MRKMGRKMGHAIILRMVGCAYNPDKINQTCRKAILHMVSKMRSLGIKGIGGYEVSVECFLSSGLPAFEKVGNLDQTHK